MTPVQQPISIGKILENGGTMEGDQEKLMVSKGITKITFSSVNVSTFKYLTKIENYKDEVLRMFEKIKNMKIDMNQAHEVMGHINWKQTKDMAKSEGFSLTGQPRVCDSYTKAKAKSKDEQKITETKARKPGECIFINTSGPYAPTCSGSRYWVKTVDHFSRYS